MYVGSTSSVTNAVFVKNLTHVRGLTSGDSRVNVRVSGCGQLKQLKNNLSILKASTGCESRFL